MRPETGKAEPAQRRISARPPPSPAAVAQSSKAAARRPKVRIAPADATREDSPSQACLPQPNDRNKQSKQHGKHERAVGKTLTKGLLHVWLERSAGIIWIFGGLAISRPRADSKSRFTAIPQGACLSDPAPQTAGCGMQIPRAPYANLRL